MACWRDNCKKPFTRSVIVKVVEELQLDECVQFTSTKAVNVYIAVARQIKELKEVVVWQGATSRGCTHRLLV